MYIDSLGRQVLTHGTTWAEINFSKCSVQPTGVGFCDICKIYLRYPALKRHNKEQHSVIEGAEALDDDGSVDEQSGPPALPSIGRDAKICLDLLNGTIAVEEERLKRVTPTDFDLAYIKQLHERRAKLEASLAAA